MNKIHKNSEIIEIFRNKIILENSNILCHLQIEINSKFIIFKLLKINDYSYFEKKYETKEINNILKLPPLLYDSLEKIKNFIIEAFKRNKFKFYQENDIIVIKIKFQIVFEEIESRIELKKIIINSDNFFYNILIESKNHQNENKISELEKKNEELKKKIEKLEDKLLKHNSTNLNNLNNLKINNYNCISILSFHEITTLILLDNKEDIASVSSNGKLIIFELKIFSIKLTINNITDKTILDIIKLSENRIVITCWDNLIRIIKLLNNNTKFEITQTLKGHTSFINAII